jgi:hypothetical protein
MRSRQERAQIMALVFMGVLPLIVAVTGCFPCGSTAARRVVSGSLLIASTLEAPSDVQRIAAWSYTDGENTGSGGGGRPVLPSLSDGSFEVTMASNDRGGVCGYPPFTHVTGVSQYPTPDQIVFIVEREACEQEFTIDLNEDTVVDLDFPDGVIELAGPILLPPCEMDDADTAPAP